MVLISWAQILKTVGPLFSVRKFNKKPQGGKLQFFGIRLLQTVFSGFAAGESVEFREWESKGLSSLGFPTEGLISGRELRHYEDSYTVIPTPFWKDQCPVSCVKAFLRNSFLFGSRNKEKTAEFNNHGTLFWLVYRISKNKSRAPWLICVLLESKDQTLPIGSRESFIWIIQKTILCLVLDFQGSCNITTGLFSSRRCIQKQKNPKRGITSDGAWSVRCPRGVGFS